MSTQARKEAVVFILDSYPSMKAPHPRIKREGAVNNNASDDEGCCTRLHCAKHAIESMLCDMILNSGAGSKALIIVTKTKKTIHHLIPLDQDPDEMDPSDLVFPNLTELGCNKQRTASQVNIMRRPDGEMIRQLWNVKPVKSMEKANQMQGDICDALILAADALYRSAYENQKSKVPYRYRRKIVLLTDACHPIVLDVPQTVLIIDSLRKMECPLHVLGLGFGLPSVEYKNPLDPSLAKPKSSTTNYDENASYHPDQPAEKKVKREPGTDDKDDDGDVKMIMDENESAYPDRVSSNDNNDNKDFIEYDTCEDREKLLSSLTEKTGGKVVSIHCLQEICKVGRRMKNSTASKTQLHVGPGLTIEVRKVKILVQESSPRIVEHAVMVDKNGNPRINGIGQEMTEPLESTKKAYYRPEKPIDDDANNNTSDGGGGEEPIQDVVGGKPVDVDETDYADAVRYGKDQIPLSELEKEGMKDEADCGYQDDTLDMSKPYIHILGFVRRDAVPYRYLVGPPYGITGSDSRRACTLIAALSRSLHTSGFVAICTVKQGVRSTPVLAGLYPFEEPELKGKGPNRLLLFTLPFCDDVKRFTMPGFHDIFEDDEGDDNDEDAKIASVAKAGICDLLIDSLMLEEDSIRSETIPSPFHMSFYKTMLRRSIKRNASDLVVAREFLDPITTPPDVLEGAQQHLKTFRDFFPLKEKKIVKNKVGKGGGNRNVASTYLDHLD